GCRWAWPDAWIVNVAWRAARVRSGRGGVGTRGERRIRGSIAVPTVTVVLAANEGRLMAEGKWARFRRRPKNSSPDRREATLHSRFALACSMKGVLGSRLEVNP